MTKDRINDLTCAPVYPGEILSTIVACQERAVEAATAVSWVICGEAIPRSVGSCNQCGLWQLVFSCFLIIPFFSFGLATVQQPMKLQVVVLSCSGTSLNNDRGICLEPRRRRNVEGGT